MTVPSQQLDARRHRVAPRHQPIAVVPDLIHPVRPGRRSSIAAGEVARRRDGSNYNATVAPGWCRSAKQGPDHGGAPALAVNRSG